MDLVDVMQHFLHDNLYLSGSVNSHRGGGRTRLPTFKFSAKFPIRLQLILQIQIKNFKNAYFLMRKIILISNPLAFNLELLLK